MTVVVVTRQNQATIEPCLVAVRAALAGCTGDGQVAVVDAASTDETVSRVKTSGHADLVIPLTTNAGFAAGCAAAAAATDSEFLVFVNPDALVEPDALSRLIEAARGDSDAAVVGGVSTTDKGDVDSRSVLRSPTLADALAFGTGLSTLVPQRGPVASLATLAQPTEVPAVSGALMLVRRTAWDALGGFDRHFRLYGEDVDLCVRARRRGYRVLIHPCARAQHAVGLSSPSTARQALVKAGEATLYRKHLNPVAANVACTALVLGTGLRAATGRFGRPAMARRGRAVTSSEAWRGAWRARHTWRDGWTGQDISAVVDAAGGGRSR